MSILSTPVPSVFAASTPPSSIPRSPSGPHTYDICFFLPGQSDVCPPGFGVKLTNDTIAWTQDDRTSEALLADIVAVHLSSSGRRVIVDRCAITFADNTVLTVVNCDPGGYRDSERAADYRAFVADLHARLASGPHRTIRFTAGWTPSRYQTMLMGAYVLAVVYAVVGMALCLMARDWRGLGIVILGGIGCWRMERTTRANAPRDYTPDNLPAQLMS
jgi:hypothetical protein